MALARRYLTLYDNNDKWYDKIFFAIKRRRFR